MSEPSELVKRLASTLFDGDVRLLLNAEKKFSKLMEQYKGYGALATAFVEFFLETVAAYNREMQPRVTAMVTAEHVLLVERLVHGFLTLRAAQLVAHRGYPLQAFTLLRNVSDDCVLTSGAMQGLTTFEELSGIKPEEPFDKTSMLKNRRNTERKVRSKMDGADGGLSAETLKWLRMLDEMYDWETHGGRLTSAYNMDWLKGHAPLAIVPKFREQPAALFMNRFCEVAWMVHRLLPLIQLAAQPLSQTWGEKWRVVDSSFDLLVTSLAKDLNKPAFTAVRDFVTTKFPFSERSYFPA